MQLIQAIAKSAPRQVNTRYGQKTVIDATGNNGQQITIWRGGDDHSPALNSIVNGSRISVGMDSKGKYSLMEAPADRATMPAPQPMGFAVEPTAPPAENNRSVEIAEYICKLGKLYRHCYKTATNELKETPLATPEVKDVATTLFIQTVRHFGL